MKLPTIIIPIFCLIINAKSCTWTFNGSCYNFDPNVQLPFFDAENYCAVNHGGHLAAITSKEEDDFLRSRLLDWNDNGKLLFKRSCLAKALLILAQL